MSESIKAGDWVVCVRLPVSGILRGPPAVYKVESFNRDSLPQDGINLVGFTNEGTDQGDWLATRFVRLEDYNNT